MPDKRIKGCPNEKCSAYKKIKFKMSDDYCSKCGNSLVLVCAKCWTPLATDNKKERICEKCKAKAVDRRQNAIKTVKQAGQVMGTAVAIVASVPKVLENIGKKE